MLRRTKSAPAILRSPTTSTATLPAPVEQEETSTLSSFADQEVAFSEEADDVVVESEPRSYGDERAHEAAALLAGMKSENPVKDGVVGAVTGRIDAAKRLPEDGLPKPTRVIEGVKRAAQVAQFVVSGGAEELTAEDVATVGLSSVRDTIENSHPIEAIKKAPNAVKKASDAAHVASTVTERGQEEVSQAVVDLAKNKGLEAGSSVATGVAASMAMRGAAAALPPIHPALIAAKGVLILGSVVVSATGALKFAYEAADLADKIDEHRDKSRHTAAAVDGVLERHAGREEDADSADLTEEEVPELEDDVVETQTQTEVEAASVESEPAAQSWFSSVYDSFFGGSSSSGGSKTSDASSGGRSSRTSDHASSSDHWSTSDDSETDAVEHAVETIDEAVEEVEALAEEEVESGVESDDGGFDDASFNFDSPFE